ncbi:hypothetical protein ABZ490_17160 [Streptomyces sp. NPDC005811]|uniref:hypothetical protein n=1 Tax=Streptomyces sp. NPDC005811 TaxID=3154565 RepID=UPI0033D72543
MAETTPEPVAPLRFVQGEADGHCDPVSGVCAVPGAVPTGPADDDVPTEHVPTEQEPQR